MCPANITSIWLLALALAARAANSDYALLATQRLVSPGRTTYYINPISGSDTNSGLKAVDPWQSFQNVNRLLLSAGDRVEVLAAGPFHQSLAAMGAGTLAAPVEIHFAAGRYDFFPVDALKLSLNISNDNDTPNTPKAVAMLFKDMRHLRVVATNTDIYIHGKMIEAMLDHAKNVSFEGLAFDYQRPTVSELTVLQVGSNWADVQVHPDSSYSLEGGRLVWVGEGWQSRGFDLAQECNLANGRVWRRDSPLPGVVGVEELASFKLRLRFRGDSSLTPGHVYQFRETLRDGAGVFTLRSRDISWQDCGFYFMHGLGIVCQFSENLAFERVHMAPRPGSGRTCAGWADLMHFSGCKGRIEVRDCEMAGASDDMMNVHGTHLRVVARPGPNQVVVRFMHPQSYGFEAFMPGDDIEFVSQSSLLAYASNRVTAAEAKDSKEILLTLQDPAPAKTGDGDVVENVTWTPSVEVSNCRVTLDSCRSFLLTTRQPVLIENNTFVKTAMPAILVSDDANLWFESGCVRDMTIRGNRFLHCGEPVIEIEPKIRGKGPAEPVHQNIRILDNYFALDGHRAISARLTGNLLIEDNRFSTSELPVQTMDCTGVTIAGNKLGVGQAQLQIAPLPGQSGF